MMLQGCDRGKDEKLEAEREEQLKSGQAAKKAQALEKCFETIELRMTALSETPVKFSHNETDLQRKEKETQLKTLARNKKEEIGEVLIELKSLQPEVMTKLNEILNSFFADFESMVYYRRSSSDYLALGDIGEADRNSKKADEISRKEIYTFAELRKLRPESAKAASNP